MDDLRIFPAAPKTMDVPIPLNGLQQPIAFHVIAFTFEDRVAFVIDSGSIERTTCDVFL